MQDEERDENDDEASEELNEFEDNVSFEKENENEDASESKEKSKNKILFWPFTIRNWFSFVDSHADHESASKDRMTQRKITHCSD